jgi:hypothetical protein
MDSSRWGAALQGAKEVLSRVHDSTFRGYIYCSCDYLLKPPGSGPAAAGRHFASPRGRPGLRFCGCGAGSGCPSASCLYCHCWCCCCPDASPLLPPTKRSGCSSRYCMAVTSGCINGCNLHSLIACSSAGLHMTHQIGGTDAHHVIKVAWHPPSHPCPARALTAANTAASSHLPTVRR